MVEKADDLLKGAIRDFVSRNDRGDGNDDFKGLASRLEERGCAYGRVINARLDEVARGYERVESKLNAVLLAATGTFISTLVGMVVYHLRGG